MSRSTLRHSLDALPALSTLVQSPAAFRRKIRSDSPYAFLLANDDAQSQFDLFPSTSAPCHLGSVSLFVTDHLSSAPLTHTLLQSHKPFALPRPRECVLLPPLPSPPSFSPLTRPPTQVRLLNTQVVAATPSSSKVFVSKGPGGRYVPFSTHSLGRIRLACSRTPSTQL